jgi:zinc/manganese transport system substrate-binding protein
MSSDRRRGIAAPIASLILILCCAGGLAAAEPLRVVATVSDLGSLAREVGGERLTVTVLARGGDDPHFVEARPSFVRALVDADCLIQVGVELEIGWLPPILLQARNPRLRLGAPGNIDASSAIALITPDQPRDRSHGDVHAGGNPHYLPDPINGWLVARLLRDRFSQLRPADAAHFAAGYARFSDRLARRLAGDALVEAHGAEAVLDQVRTGTVAETPALGGWLQRLAGLRGQAVVVDHDQWPYFAQRFGLVAGGFIEERPGVPPSARHLMTLARRMQAEDIRLLLSSPVYDRRPLDRVAEASGARVVVLPHQVGALPGTDDYLAFIEACVVALEAAGR